jgi:hypothetical protein
MGTASLIYRLTAKRCLEAPVVLMSSKQEQKHPLQEGNMAKQYPVPQAFASSTSTLK